MTDEGKKKLVLRGIQRDRHPVFGWYWVGWVDSTTQICDHRHKHGHEAMKCAKERADAVTGA